MAINITSIEMICEREAAEAALESMIIKDHNIYFVDFADSAFGYSVLVYRDAHHIYYANDYALHHPGHDQEELKALYIKRLNNILFTDQELTQPPASYDEEKRKRHYLHSYYGMRRDYVSMFHITHSEKEKRDFDRKISKMVKNPIAFAYYDQMDAAFVRDHIALFRQFNKAAETMESDFEYMKSAFLYEMYNHEYGINWQANYDTLSVFGDITYNENDDPAIYMDQLNFSSTQKNAYYAARRQYWEETKDW